MARPSTSVRNIESALTPEEERALKIQTAKAWKPAVNESIKGVLVKIVKRQGDYAPYPCLILEVDGVDGFVAVHSFHGVLLDQLREARPVTGDTLTIIYAGKRANAKGKLDSNGNVREYHGYALIVNGGTPDEEWDLGEAEATPAEAPTDAPEPVKPARVRGPRKALRGAEVPAF